MIHATHLPHLSDALQHIVRRTQRVAVCCSVLHPHDPCDTMSAAYSVLQRILSILRFVTGMQEDT